MLAVLGLSWLGQGAGAQASPPPSAVQTYTVRPGDTAYSVARLAGTDVPTLLRLNELTAGDLKPGQTLKLPAGPPQPAAVQPVSTQPVSPAAPRSHTVQPGQTLYSVARLYGLKTGEIQDFNRLNSAGLRPGQVLLLPSGAQGVQASPAAVPAPVVVAAPTRPALPKPILPNPILPRPIPPRPVAVAPASLPVAPLSPAALPTHTVQPGQTLYAVARLYNLRADDLLALNHLSSSDLRAGQVLLLPVGVTVQPAPAGSMLPGVAAPSSAVPSGATFSPGVPLPVMLPAPPAPDLLAPGSPRSDLPMPAAVPALAESPSDWRGVAMSLLGVPYVYGGQSRTGTDCSGLVLQVFADTGLKLPRQSAQQAQIGAVVGLSDLQAGDLLFFDTEGRGTVTHVGIYLGDGEFINANSYGGQVAVNLLSEKYFAQRYLWARRVLGVLAQDH